jgi:hypothetical protein
MTRSYAGAGTPQGDCRAVAELVQSGTSLRKWTEESTLQLLTNFTMISTNKGL